MPIDTRNLEARRKRLVAGARHAALHVAELMDSRIGYLATRDMWTPDVAGGRGKSARMRAAYRENNITDYLRIRTGALKKSYLDRDNEYHIFDVTFDGGVLVCNFGSRQVSPKGFPYAAAHEDPEAMGITLYKARPHLKRAWKEFKAEGALVVFGEIFANELVKVWNENR